MQPSLVAPGMTRSPHRSHARLGLLGIALGAACALIVLWSLGGTGGVRGGAAERASSHPTAGDSGPAALTTAARPVDPAPPLPPETREERAGEPPPRQAAPIVPRAPSDLVAATRTVIGRVVLPDRRPAQGRVILSGFLDQVPANAREMQLDEDGFFRLALEPDWTHVALDSRVPEQAPYQGLFPLRPGPGEQDLGVIVLPRGGTLLGQIRGLSCFDDWSVTAIPRDPSLPLFLQRRGIPACKVAKDGSVRIENVPPGVIALALQHPLLGDVAERELAVSADQTTSFELRYDGFDPCRALVVEISAERAPESHELWIRGPGGEIQAPDVLRPNRAVFTDLQEGPYDLTLALRGSDPVEQGGLLPGMRTWIESPAKTAQRTRMSAEAEERASSYAAAFEQAAKDGTFDPSKLPENIRVRVQGQNGQEGATIEVRLPGLSIPR